MTQAVKTGPKIGMISFAHMHARSYANALNTLGVGITGIYDDDAVRAEEDGGAVRHTGFRNVGRAFYGESGRRDRLLRKQ